ncbi:hypothetical protein KC845_01645 [Candidatus Kaiserbacteria bacterium]|nr:hypothetical protein [Candidatus Kaiserbacteria bacterium]
MKLSDNKKLIKTLSIIAIAVLLVVAAYATLEYRYLSEVKQLAGEKETKLIELSTHLKNNTSPGGVRGLVRDCPIEERASFDTNLGNLSNLNKTELSDLQLAFERCAYFYPLQRAYLVSVSQNLLSDYIELMEIIDQSGKFVGPNEVKTNLWKKVVALEARRADLDLELVETQKNIINYLSSGESTDSEVIISEIAQARELSKSILETRDEILTVHSEINSL